MHLIMFLTPVVLIPFMYGCDSLKTSPTLAHLWAGDTTALKSLWLCIILLY